jgi:hypothetical protein
VTDQAVDVLFLREIKLGVLPAITSMTTRTTGPVTLDADAEVVNVRSIAIEDPGQSSLK